MPITERENYLRTVAGTNPEWIPSWVVVSDASWLEHGDEIADVMARHSVLFPGFERRTFKEHPGFGLHSRRGEAMRDTWGCVYETGIDGLMGLLKQSPLADWCALESYRAPDGLVEDDNGPADWEGRRRSMEALREASRPVYGAMPHGFLFLRLWYLRGFENLMLDLALDEPNLHRLIEIVQQHNRTKAEQWLNMDLDVLYFGEDMGTQTAPLISPAMFRKWFAEPYRQLTGSCHKAGTYVYLHSDGHVLELVDEWRACGVDIVNIQDLCNGIDNLAAQVKGTMCLSLDIDRQTIVPFGSRQEIYDLVEEEVQKLGSPHGGLELICGIYPPTPPENFDAVCEAIEKLRTYWW